MKLDEWLQGARIDYIPEHPFDETTLSANPLQQFEFWLQHAIEEKIPEPNAMVLSTGNLAGEISSRVVLLKEITSNGLIFYTNYQSQKARDLEENQHVALNFFWQPLSRQVRIQGKVTKTTPEQSDHYFSQRPRESQIAAWASIQSHIIANRAELENNMEQMRQHYVNIITIPRPVSWGGYCINPHHFEFWQGNRNRLHDRICYELTKTDQWKIQRLAP